MDTGEIRKSVSLFGCRSEAEIEWYQSIREEEGKNSLKLMLLTAAATTVVVADYDST